ncbi:MAG: hypothetical protein JSW54_04350, partial [Fidelibacterota bacterium]
MSRIIRRAPAAGRPVNLAVLVLVFIVGACDMQKARSDLAGLLPDGFGGWVPGRADEVYDRETLYDYIDGGAELYLSYGFRSMISRVYSREGQPDVVVDIFDMGSSADAFGVFSHSKETATVEYGQGSQRDPGFLMFWKGVYVVSLLASPETEASREALHGLATYIDAAIADEGPPPEMLNLLPVEDLVEESTRYFHHHVWLNAHYYVADENILNIDAGTDAVLARYGEEGSRHTLLIVSYGGETEARQAHESFLGQYLPDRGASQAVQLEDGAWTASRSWDRCV